MRNGKTGTVRRLLLRAACASTYMTAYFNTGALPPKGTVCHQNLPPFPPPAG